MEFSIDSDATLRRPALNEISRSLVRAAFVGQPLDLVAMTTDTNYTAAVITTEGY